MLKVKSEIWTNSKGKRFVVVPEADFARLAELAEDAGLSRILRQAKREDEGGPGVPLGAVKRRLAARGRGKGRRG